MMIGHLQLYLYLSKNVQKIKLSTNKPVQLILIYKFYKQWSIFMMKNNYNMTF